MSSTKHNSGVDGEVSRWQPLRSEHLAFLASPRWADMLRRDLLPWLLADTTLGEQAKWWRSFKPTRSTRR